MKTWGISERHYFKIVETSTEKSWKTPNLTAETSNGITVTDNHNKGGPAWKACATSSGYKSGYYSGKYKNESSTTYTITWKFTTDFTCTGYTFYTASVNGNSDWNTAWKSGIFYGSQNGSSWTQLHSHRSVNRNTTATYTFTNSVAYKYYKYVGTSTGSGHKDQINYSSFHLTGSIITEDDTVVETDSSDYTYYIDIFNISALKTDNDTVKGNYTSVGTLSFSDGILSGFTNDNYGVIPINFCNYEIESYELCFKYRYTQRNDGRIIGNSITNTHTPQINLSDTSSDVLWYGHPSADNSWISFYLDLPTELNTWYWLKIIWDGSNIEIYRSEDGLTWTLTAQGAAESLGWDEQIQLGADRNNYFFIGGEIDLKECYIKINSDLIWQGLLPKYCIFDK